MPRSETIPGITLGTEYSDGSSPFVWKTSTLGTLKTIASNGHYGYPDFPADRNVGGTFVQHNERILLNPVAVGQIWRGGTLNQRYEGSMCASSAPPIGSVSNQDGSSRAAEAFYKMKPTKPLLNTLNAIYELKDLPGMLRERYLHQGLKAIPNYWLGLQFGWKPLLQDTINLVTFQRKMQERLAWLIRHNGKPVRRAVQLAEFESDSVISGGGLAFTALQPVLVTQYYASEPTWHDTHTSGERWWATARFRYWLPEGPQDINWRRSMLAKLYGLEPSPSVVYRAIPWSWLVDWFTNVGTVLQNLETGVADRLAADYCYMMRYNWARCERHAHGTFNTKSGFPVTVDSSSNYWVEHKTRVMGDPFGFGTNPNTLNGTQLSILGALGLSKL